MLFENSNVSQYTTGQLRITTVGTASFVNYSFHDQTGSGFYSTGSSPALTPHYINLAFGSTDKFSFSSSGLFRAADDVVAFYSFSDKRLKTDIRPICGSTALKQIQQLQGVYYKWVDGTRKDQDDIGLIAQDVENIVPEVIREYERIGAPGVTFKSVDYEHLVGLLVEAIKEQQTQIDELKIKVNALTK